MPAAYHDDLTLATEEICALLTDEIELLIMVNPNNSTGEPYSKEALKTILNTAAKHNITVLIDEAYADFYSYSSIDEALNHDHIFVMRTFSKFFSMASCRLAYIAGWKDGIDVIRKLNVPFGTNSFAIKFADKILENDKLIKQMQESNKTGKKYLLEYLIKHEYIVRNTDTK